MTMSEIMTSIPQSAEFVYFLRPVKVLRGFGELSTNVATVKHYIIRIHVCQPKICIKYQRFARISYLFFHKLISDKYKTSRRSRRS